MNIGLLIEQAGKWYGDDTAIIWKERKFSFRQISDNANRLANGLIALGLNKGDRVAIIMNSCPEYLEADFACYKAGMIRTGINQRLTAKEFSSLITSVEANTIVLGSEFAKTIKQIRHELACVKNYLCVEGLANNSQDMLDYHNFISNKPSTKPDVEIKDEDVAMLFFTGGTTGIPKGAIFTHSILMNTWLNQQADQYHLTRKDKILQIGSLAHGGGLRTYGVFGKGVCMLFLDRFEVKEVLETIEREKVTILNFVPTTLNRFIRYPNIKDYDLSSVRLMTYGAGPTPAALMKEAIKLLGQRFVQFYGQAEAPMTITVLPPNEHVIDGSEEEMKRLGSVGRPFINVEVRVVNKEDQDVAPGEVGEIIVRSPHCMKEYWKKPETTKEKIKNGWIYTDDLATVDSHGYIYMAGRSRDIIISGGYNIYPIEVEEALYSHPSVLEASVIGVPNEEWGEAVKALVVLKKGVTCTADELIEHCKKKVGFKKPQYVEFVEELPKSAVGKILKR